MKKTLVILFIFFSTSSSWGGVFVEPYIGSGLGIFNNWRYGYSIGTRLGYSRWGLMMGVDASYSSFSSFTVGIDYVGPVCEIFPGLGQLTPCKALGDEWEPSTVGIYHNIFLGPTVAFGLPFIIDAYTSFGWNWASTSFKHHTIPVAGPAIKVGVSYLNLPFFRLNLETQMILLKCTDLEEVALSRCQDETKFQSVTPVFTGQIYISIPINTGLL